MVFLFYGNCQVRLLKNVLNFLLEGAGHSFLIFQDIDKISEGELEAIYSLLKYSDVVVSTRVTSYKTERYWSDSIFSEASSACIEVPSLYFDGLCPSVGELVYPNGGSGYEDIWIYDLLLRNMNLLGDAAERGFLVSRLREFYRNDNFALSSAQSGALRACFDKLWQAARLRLSLPPNSSNTRVQMVDVLPIIDELISRGGRFSIFYTPNHPSISVVLEIALSITSYLGLEVRSERLESLQSSSLYGVDMTSVDFIKFELPAAYAAHFNFPRCYNSYMMYRPRYSIGKWKEISLSDYVHQLIGRVQKNQFLEENLTKLDRYRKQDRLINLDFLLG